MKNSSPAPQPDPNIGRSALLQAKTGEKWLNFSKEAFKVSNTRQRALDRLTTQVTNQQLAVGDEMLRTARADRQRYENEFVPLEREYVKEASEYGSEQRQQEAATEARADVQAAAAAARLTAEREAMSLGINPASGRFAGIQKAGEVSTALASAGAANTARKQQRDTGLALKADAVNLGRGLPALSAQGTAMGLDAGSTALGLRQGTNAQYLASTNIMNSGFSGQMGGYQGMGSTLNGLYNTQVAAWDAENRNRAAAAQGIGGAIGGIAGLIFSDEDAKTDKEPIAEGEALEALKEMPVETWRYQPGLGDDRPHVGTYAQDFQKATGKGDGKTIPAQDAIGVTMAAVQDLDKKVERIADAMGLDRKRSAPANDQPGLTRRKAA